MPIYEYRCNECGEKFEKWLRSMSATEDVRCPRCGSRRVAKAISLFGKSGSAASAAASDASCAPTGG
ncbi:MAG: zinc ribbon domain-containing protein [Chloroflexi bacterium]|nr:zinc ribbon domain-containing protein [Chloroflexota bacterium]